jgi:hypothetical protein
MNGAVGGENRGNFASIATNTEAAVGSPLVTLHNLIQAAERILQLEPSQIGLYKENISSLRTQLAALSQLNAIRVNAASSSNGIAGGAMEVAQTEKSAEEESQLAELEQQLLHRNERISLVLERLRQLQSSIQILSTRPH